MKTIPQRSSFTLRFHCYDAQGTPAVPLTASWKLMRGTVVVQDWTALEVETVTEGGALVDVYADVALISGLTVMPGDYTVHVTLDKDTDTELTQDVPFKVRQVIGR